MTDWIAEIHGHLIVEGVNDTTSHNGEILIGEHWVKTGDDEWFPRNSVVSIVEDYPYE